jgi:hypothetical protein
VRISGLPLGSPETKSHLDVAPAERRKIYYKGEGGVRAMVSLVCPSCPWFVLAPKVLQLCIKYYVLVLCKFVVPSRSSSTPLYPFIVLQARECASTPCYSVVFNLGFTFESFKELGVHQISIVYYIDTYIVYNI